MTRTMKSSPLILDDVDICWTMKPAPSTDEMAINAQSNTSSRRIAPITPPAMNTSHMACGDDVVEEIRQDGTQNAGDERHQQDGQVATMGNELGGEVHSREEAEDGDKYPEQLAAEDQKDQTGDDTKRRHR